MSFEDICISSWHPPDWTFLIVSIFCWFLPFASPTKNSFLLIVFLLFYTCEILFEIKKRKRKTEGLSSLTRRQRRRCVKSDVSTCSSSAPPVIYWVIEDRNSRGKQFLRGKPMKRVNALGAVPCIIIDFIAQSWRPLHPGNPCLTRRQSIVMRLAAIRECIGTWDREGREGKKLECVCVWERGIGVYTQLVLYVSVTRAKLWQGCEHLSVCRQHYKLAVFFNY